MNILQEIFIDHYEEMIYTFHPRDSVIENVEKMINCGNPAFGGAMYSCPHCGKLKFVPFRCHSRFCPTCGNLYAMQRTTSMSFKLVNVTHRHCVFTIDQNLRDFFLNDRSMLDCLFHAVNNVVSHMFFKQNKSMNFTPGFIMVLHTFGRDLKSLGILLLHTKVRDGASKGKVERYFRTLKERWLYTLDMDSITSLAQFNGLLKDYMRSYNTTFHRGIDGIPLDRYEASKEHPRKPLSREWLEDCFYNRITRKVRKDSTITIDNVCYDVPMQFISAKVNVRYLPDDMNSAYILYEDTKFPIHRTDRNDNRHTKRNNLPPIDYSIGNCETRDIGTLFVQYG